MKKILFILFNLLLVQERVTAQEGLCGEKSERIFCSLYGDTLLITKFIVLKDEVVKYKVHETDQKWDMSIFDTVPKGTNQINDDVSTRSCFTVCVNIWVEKPGGFEELRESCVFTIE